MRVQVPDGGLNIHNEPLGWSLRDGRVVYWSLLQLKDKRPDELIEANCYEAYRDVAKEFGPLVETVRAATTCSAFTGSRCDIMCLSSFPSTGYDCCGVAISEDDLAELRADMGVLSDRRWLALEWEMPADEACPCWWIATADG